MATLRCQTKSLGLGLYLGLLLLLQQVGGGHSGLSGEGPVLRSVQGDVGGGGGSVMVCVTLERLEDLLN